MKTHRLDLDAGHRVYAIEGWLGAFHLLHDAEKREAVLIDTGLVGELGRLERLLGEIGLAWKGIRAILLTHGHLDHTGGLAQLKAWTGAPVMAHPAEQAHIDGTFPYRGPSRICGAAEAVGRAVFRYRTVRIDEPLSDGMELPWWGGLEVVHLPGHTAGHCGFFSPRFGLLFSGDLFASYTYSTHLPPPFLNSCAEQFPASLRRVEQLSPRLVIPNHYQNLDGELHRRRFDQLISRRSAAAA